MSSPGLEMRLKRLALKMSQQTLARKLSVSQKQISYWENDREYPSQKQKRALTKALKN